MGRIRRVSNVRRAIPASPKPRVTTKRRKSITLRSSFGKVRSGRVQKKEVDRVRFGRGTTSQSTRTTITTRKGPVQKLSSVRKFKVPSRTRVSKVSSVVKRPRTSRAVPQFKSAGVESPITNVFGILERTSISNASKRDQFKREGRTGSIFFDSFFDEEFL